MDVFVTQGIPQMKVVALFILFLDRFSHYLSELYCTETESILIIDTPRPYLGSVDLK